MSTTPGASRGLRLAIETSNPGAAADPARGASVALGEVAAGGAVRELGCAWLHQPGPHDDDLMPAIDRLVRGAGARPAEIRSIAVSVGPGGYTAVRVAVATARMIALANGAGCVAVPSALVAAWSARAAAVDSDEREHVIVALASKGDTAWLHEVHFGGREVAPPALGDGAALARLIGCGARAVVADRHLPEPLRCAAADAGIAVVEAAFTGAACLGASMMLPEIEAGLLVPVYPREPDAVRLWRERKK